MMKSLYGMFIEERENKNIVESEKGFATYYFIDDSVYIETIFVHPDYRDTGETFVMAGKIAKIAKEKGCTKMLGSVCPTAKGSSTSLCMLLTHGFKLDSSTNNFIVVKKDI
jgi:hypothetical protein